MHKFKVGELVRIRSGQATQLKGAVYEIVRLLPPETGGAPMYHVKGTEEDYLRMVAEHDIEHSSPSKVRGKRSG